MSHIVYLARHGETEWSRDGRHTGRKDLPLTDRGRSQAAALGKRLEGIDFAHVFTSPLERAWETCSIAGFGEVAERSEDLVEWDYGSYEGLTTAEISRDRPGWDLWRDGPLEGESFASLGGRADGFLTALRMRSGASLLFSHGHMLRAIAARWLGLSVNEGSLFGLDPATVCILAYEHGDDPILKLWNDGAHLGT